MGSLWQIDGVRSMSEWRQLACAFVCTPEHPPLSVQTLDKES